MEFNNYHEVFLGGAATYFFLKPNGHAYLSDLNERLVETYQAVKENVEAIIEALALFQNTKDSYYIARETTFSSKEERVAQFIYLNQTSFNGIHRVNLNGKYNVPYGFRKKKFLDADALRLASKALINTTIFKSDFMLTLENINNGDLVFLDPPYTVSHNNNGFINYNEKIFSLDDQYRLSKLIDEIKKKNAFYILTNAAHSTIEDIFEKGDNKLILSRTNAIGGKKAARGQISELVFTNINL